MASAKRRKEKIIRRKLLKSDILKVLRGQQIISWKGEKTGKRKDKGQKTKKQAGFSQNEQQKEKANTEEKENRTRYIVRQRRKIRYERKSEYNKEKQIF